MKKIITLILLTLSVSAVAKSFTLHTTLYTNAQVSADFAVNGDLGRAWIHLEIDEGPTDPDSDSYDRRVKVEGLTYDSDLEAVLYKTGDKTTVCAQLKSRGRGIFRSIGLVKTGECIFKSELISKMVDDGFYIKRKSYLVTSLVIK
jgi:hypothetical protein